MFKLEKKILEFVKRNYILFFMVFVTIIAIVVRIKMFSYDKGDYLYFLSPWFDDLKANGGFKALANYKGDYNAPYMTILAFLTYLPINSLISIKLVSVIFDFALALSCGFLIKELVNKNKKEYFAITYSVVLFIPSVLLNGACWAQCDSIYATFVILSLLFLIKEKHVLSFIMLGVAFSFKLQFIFILPLYLVLYVVKKNFSLLNFLIIPFVNIILCLPAIIAGKPFLECITIYFNQTSTYKESLVLNFPNIYKIFNGNPDIFYTVGELVTIFVCAFTLFFIIFKKIKFNNEKILLLAIWFITIITFLLPGMHERYLFMGEILSILYFIVYKKNGFFALFINMCSIITYSNFLNAMSFEYMQLLSIGFLIVIYFYTKSVFYTLKDNSNNKKNIIKFNQKDFT